MRIVIFLRYRSARAFPSSVLTLSSYRNIEQRRRVRAHSKLMDGFAYIRHVDFGPHLAEKVGA